MQNDTSFFPREPLVEFARGMHRETAGTRASTTHSLQPFLTQQIGYQILSRIRSGRALGHLLWRVGRGRRVVLSRGPSRANVVDSLRCWSSVASLVFVGIATATKKSVPPTVATVTRVAFEPGLGTGHSCGLVAMYNQEACRDRVGATRGGVFFPDMTAMSGRRRRVVWTDEGTWHWEDLELPAGVRTAPFQRPVPLDVTVDCRAQFGPVACKAHWGRCRLRSCRTP